MRFYITGGWGYGNRGDNAIFEATRQSLTDQFPGHSLAVSSFSVDEVRSQHALDSIPSVHRFLTKKSPLALLRWSGVVLWKMTHAKFFLSPALRRHLQEMRDADVVIMAGGGYFNDAWLDMLFSRFVEIELAHASGSPMVIIGQTLGPFGRDWTTRMLGHSLRKVRAIAHRDVQSLDVLRRAEVPAAKCTLSADEVNLLRVRKAASPRSGAALRIGVMVQIFRPHLGAAGPSPAGRIASSEQYIAAISEALEQCLGRHPSLELHFIPSTTWDEPTCRLVFERLKGKADAHFHVGPHTTEFIDLCQGVDVMLSTNMHPIILATTAGKGSVAISYHYKLDDYMKSIDQGKNVVRIDDFSSAELAALLDEEIKSAGTKKVDNTGVQTLARENIKAVQRALVPARSRT